MVLLALGTGQRAQTLSFFKIFQISLNEKLVIRVPDRIKTTAPGRPFFTFSSFVENDNLYIYSLLKHYLNITKIYVPLIATHSSFLLWNHIKQLINKRLAVGYVQV